MVILKKRGWEIPESQATPEHVFLSRRSLIRGAATIVAAAFEGLSRIARHQRVYAALGERMREQIHALSMKTLTPAEYARSAQG